MSGDFLAPYALRDPFVAAQRNVTARRAPPVQPIQEPQLPKQEPFRGFGGGEDENGAAVSRLAQVAQKLAEPQEQDPRSVLAEVDRRLRSMPQRPRMAAGVPEASYDDTGLPANYFGRLKGPESGGNYAAVNPTTKAGGGFQFLPTTWDGLMRQRPDLGLKPGGLYDPSPEGVAQQERAVRAYTDVSRKALVPFLGRNPTAGELYSLHFFGHGGGMNFLKNLEAPARASLPQAYFDANPWLKAYADQPGAVLLQKLNQMMG